MKYNQISDISTKLYKLLYYLFTSIILAKSQITYCFNLMLDFALFAADRVFKMNLVMSNIVIARLVSDKNSSCYKLLMEIFKLVKHIYHWIIISSNSSAFQISKFSYIFFSFVTIELWVFFVNTLEIFLECL